LPSPTTEETIRLKLPWIMPSQAQKHVTHNEALVKLDALIHLCVEARNVDVPPENAVEGTCFIIGAAPAGIWTGHQGNIAISCGGDVWDFLAPFTGLQAYVKAEQTFVFHTGAAWTEGTGGFTELKLDRLRINSEIGSSGRLAVESDSIIFSHDSTKPGGGDLRSYLNKLSDAKTASLIFQTNWSGRAEFGLAGDDDFSIKVSQDGAAWKTSLKFDRADGRVLAPESLVVGTAVASTAALTIAKPVPTMTLRDTDSVGTEHMGVVNWVDGDGVQKAWMGLGSSGNSLFTFLSQYSDGIAFYAHGGNYPITFRQSTAIRLNIHTNGYVGVNEAAPTAPLHVNGAIRVGSVTVAQLPSATTLGAGTMIYVSNASGGATIAYSDGTNWRRIHDRVIVT